MERLEVLGHVVAGAGLPGHPPGLALEAGEHGHVAVVGGGGAAHPAVAGVGRGGRVARARGLRHVQGEVVHDIPVLHHLDTDREAVRRASTHPP